MDFLFTIIGGPLSAVAIAGIIIVAGTAICDGAKRVRKRILPGR